MDATPIDFAGATPLDADLADATGRKWAALHDAAALVAGLAGLSPQPSGAAEDFLAAIRKAPQARRELAEQGVDDLTAIMEPGLAALISVHGSGGDARAAAGALWQEFVAARDAVAALVLPPDGL
jgi:hypothetical protein